MAAPAENLVGGLPGGLYADWSGTSGATPLVSGVAALIRSKYPDMSAAQVINRIISTAKDSGVPGHDPIYGYGILNAEAALNAEVPEVAANPLGSIAQWIPVHRRGAVAAPESQSPVQSKAAAPDIPEPTTPVAVPPRTENSVLPAILISSFGALIAGVLALGAVQTVRARRAAAGKQAVEDADTGFIPPIQGREPEADQALILRSATS